MRARLKFKCIKLNPLGDKRNTEVFSGSRGMEGMEGVQHYAGVRGEDGRGESSGARVRARELSASQQMICACGPPPFLLYSWRLLMSKSRSRQCPQKKSSSPSHSHPPPPRHHPALALRTRSTCAASLLLLICPLLLPHPSCSSSTLAQHNAWL